MVHTICYSILLLNTDLHMADIESRMTRSQFVRNTLPTVTRVCQDAVKTTGGETLRPQSTHFRRPSLPWNDKSEPVSPSADATGFPAEVAEESAESRKTRSRLSIRPPMRSGSEGFLSNDSATSESNMLVNSPYNGPMRGWEFQIEIVLKDFYESIRKQRLPLHGSSAPVIHPQPSTNNLSVSNMLRRTPSMLSKTPSDNLSYRGRSQGDFRSVGNRWTSKNRSKQKLYPSSTVASSRTSLDDGSVWSPAGSSTWSRYSYGKTGTSMSMDSLGSHFAAGDYQQAIGFANALSQAIIREEGMTIASDEEFSRVAPLLEDETLELVGAPWAKEGILKHKRHLDAADKRAKDRTWSECFAVVEKGYMRLFSFSMNSKSMRLKNKTRPSAGSVVGGGNWMDNAEALDSFPLRQTIASALPPPGYSKARPHVFALSLPNGAVHLFQVGTPDIVREFVLTTNYWSARLSKEPLTGGVSSMEYGWGENVINPALIRQDSSPSVQGHMPRPSVTSSLRSSMDHATGTPKARLPGDKITLNDWTPPSCSMMASTLMEVDQLRALTDYVKNIEGELGYHNELRAPLLIAVSISCSFTMSNVLTKHSSPRATPTPQELWPTGNASPSTFSGRLSSSEHTSTPSPPPKCRSKRSTPSARLSKRRKVRQTRMHTPVCKLLVLMVRDQPPKPRHRSPSPSRSPRPPSSTNPPLSFCFFLAYTDEVLLCYVQVLRLFDAQSGVYGFFILRSRVCDSGLIPWLDAVIIIVIPLSYFCDSGMLRYFLYFSL